MSLGDLDILAVIFIQLQGTGQHFVFFDSVKKCNLIFRFGQEPVSVIDADLRTGVDAVLAFPELDQPCFTLVIKIYGKRIKHHLEPGRHIVVEPCVAGGLLPGVGELSRCG